VARPRTSLNLDLISGRKRNSSANVRSAAASGVTTISKLPRPDLGLNPEFAHNCDMRAGGEAEGKVFFRRMFELLERLQERSRAPLLLQLALPGLRRQDYQAYQELVQIDFECSIL
jgi:hypothetical protein